MTAFYIVQLFVVIMLVLAIQNVIKASKVLQGRIRLAWDIIIVLETRVGNLEKEMRERHDAAI